MAGLLPLLIALTIVETAAHPGRAAADPRNLAVWLALLTGLWWLTCETTARVLAGRAVASEGRAHR